MAKNGVSLISAPFLLMLLAVMMESGSTTVSASDADVTIYNRVGHTILVQCKGQQGREQGHDLGMRTITDGQSFGWGFSPNNWMRTRYICSFSCPWSGGVQNNFSVWDNAAGLAEVEQLRPCTHCVWRVFKDGFYRNERGRPPVFVRAWMPAS